MEIQRADFLVIGSGVAGLRAAIGLSAHGSVVVLTKDLPHESSSEYAQGGVAVAMSDEDTIGIHFEDTIKAGDGLCSELAVQTLVEEGPDRINELISWGAEFDMSESKLAFTLEAAHSRRRVLHAHGDSTGRELVRVLINKARSLKNISRYSFAYVLDLIVFDNKCYGAYILKDGVVSAILSGAVILSTGGVGNIFSRTTNPAVTTGDGMAVAFRAGAIFSDMEFIQFHPTTLFAPAAPQFLLSEALRGEGALLRNIHKEEFMKRYHDAAELAPRDIVSRAIISEMVKTESSHVYLDVTHIDGDFIKRRFPMIYSTCLKYDINITRELVPVSPSAHYIMGGVKTDQNGGTNIRGLLAAGEVACTGVHGANRLASNSLLEGLVYGARAGGYAPEYTVNPSEIKSDDLKIRPMSPSISDFDTLRHDLRKVMWERVGIIRCGESLGEARDFLERFEWSTDKWYMKRHENELVNMAQTARLITESALLRRCCIGAHFRSDCIDAKETCLYNIDVWKGVDNKICSSMIKVKR